MEHLIAAAADRLRSDGSVTTSGLAAHLGVSYAEARRVVWVMMERGLLRRGRRGYDPGRWFDGIDLSHVSSD